MAERYEFKYNDRDSVVAWRYAGNDQNKLDKITIYLNKSKPFQFRFPDGHWAVSNEITVQTLKEHVVPRRGSNSREFGWVFEAGGVAYLAGRHKNFFFYDDYSGNIRLEISACGYSFDELFKPLDANRAFGFPLSASEARELFGQTVKVERFSILTGITCI